MTFSSFQVYTAMFAFLEKEWEKNKDSYFSVVLSELVITDAGGTVDPTLWHEWLINVYTFKKSHFSALDGLYAVLIFLEDYLSRCYHDDINNVINKLKHYLEIKPVVSSVWDEWVSCLNKVRCSIDYSASTFTDFEVFKAARLFLDNHATIEQSRFLESMYMDMLINKYGYTNNPNAWKNWLGYLKQCKHTIQITPDKTEEIVVSAQEGFKALSLLIQDTHSKLQLSFFDELLTRIQLDNNGYPQDSALWEEWIDCFRRLNYYQVRRIPHSSKSIAYTS